MFAAHRIGDQLIGGGHGLLCLHHLKASGNACGIAIARLFEFFSSQVNLLPGHLHLLVRGLHVQQRGADFKFHAAMQVFKLHTALAKLGFGLVDISLHLSSLKNWNAQTGSQAVSSL